jgi:hypothetical protein
LHHPLLKYHSSARTDLLLLLLPLLMLQLSPALLLLHLSQFQQLNLVNKSRQELEEDSELPHWVVHPHDIRCAAAEPCMCEMSSSSYWAVKPRQWQQASLENIADGSSSSNVVVLTCRLQ